MCLPQGSWPHYLVERVRHLKQYIRSDEKCRKTTRNPNDQVPMDSAALRAIISYIHGGPIDEKYNPKWKRQRLLRVESIREQVSSI